MAAAVMVEILVLAAVMVGNPGDAGGGGGPAQITFII